MLIRGEVFVVCISELSTTPSVTVSATELSISPVATLVGSFGVEFLVLNQAMNIITLGRINKVFRYTLAEISIVEQLDDFLLLCRLFFPELCSWFFLFSVSIGLFDRGEGDGRRVPLS